MELDKKDQNALAFAELVQQQTARLTIFIGNGDTQAAMDLAISLGKLAARRRMEILGEPLADGEQLEG